ncbi:MAG: hypothetical protein KA974_12025 [Saprospiraceae bacterium]|nr:hypothetical protein [Saprospiraceae bacterium]MBP7680073.1 hypothetical protein [Saprospiraceae bacterium]
MNAILKSNSSTNYPHTHVSVGTKQSVRFWLTLKLQCKLLISYWYGVLTAQKNKEMLSENTSGEPLYKDVRFWVVVISFLLLVGLTFFNYSVTQI